MSTISASTLSASINKMVQAALDHAFDAEVQQLFLFSLHSVDGHGRGAALEQFRCGMSNLVAYYALALATLDDDQLEKQ